MKNNILNYAAMLAGPCNGSAVISGSSAYPDIRGIIRFYQTDNGVLTAAEICGLPESEKKCHDPVFGFHIHSGTRCDGDMRDPFSGAMSHYNPDECEHPFHAGDLLPLFGNDGHSFTVFLSSRFSVTDVIGKTVIIHRDPDDFTSQPSGNAGEKIACGIIVKCGKCY